MMDKVGTIHPPELPSTIPSHSQWLYGQGGGVWFCINKTENQNEYNIKRFTPEGELDCDRIFKLEDNGVNFDIEESYQFTHISHCAKCRIIQNGITYTFNFKQLQ